MMTIWMRQETETEDKVSENTGDEPRDRQMSQNMSQMIR